LSVEAFWPAAGAVKHRQDLDAFIADAIRDDKRRIGDDKFTRARNAARSTGFRLLRERIDPIENARGLSRAI